jgi:hypothetical protein
MTESGNSVNRSHHQGQVEVEVLLQPTVSQAVCPGIRPPSGAWNQF